MKYCLYFIVYLFHSYDCHNKTFCSPGFNFVSPIKAACSGFECNGMVKTCYIIDTKTVDGYLSIRVHARGPSRFRRNRPGMVAKRQNNLIRLSTVLFLYFRAQIIPKELLSPRLCEAKRRVISF